MKSKLDQFKDCKISKILITEGSGDQESFLERLLNHCGISPVDKNKLKNDLNENRFDTDQRIEDILVVGLGGIDELNKRIKSELAILDFDYLKKIVIVRDAEQESPEMIRSNLQTLLLSVLDSKLDLENLPGSEKENKKRELKEFEINKLMKFIPSVDCFVLPNNKELGFLEHIILSSIEEDQLFKEIVIPYINSINTLPGVWKGKEKKTVQAYLAAHKDKPFVSSIGSAAQKDYWNFNSSTFIDLKKFLIKFVK